MRRIIAVSCTVAVLASALLAVGAPMAGAQGSEGEAIGYPGGRLVMVAPSSTFQAGAAGAPGRLTIAAPKGRPSLYEDLVGKDRRFKLTQEQADDIIRQFSASLDAIVRVPGAKKSEDAAALTLSNVQIGDDGSISADATVEASADNPILQDDDAGIDPTLPADAGETEVIIAAPAPSSANQPPQGGAPNGQIEVTGNVVKFAIKANLSQGDPKHPNFYSLQPGARSCAENLQTVVNLWNVDTRTAAFSTATNPACWFSDSDATWNVTYRRWKKTGPKEDDGYYEDYKSFQLQAVQFTAGTWFATCKPSVKGCETSTFGVYTVGATFGE
jgi:hypothetical protein